MESRRLINRLALSWGVAEGVLFFVVPDVLLTLVAARAGLRRGLNATWWALGGAVIGGLIAFCWGALSPDTANAAMAALPAVDDAMVATVADQVADSGPVALVTAPLHGRPYKLYAAAAGAGDESPLLLVLWTIPGRLWRFVGLVALFGAISAGRRRWLTQVPSSTPTALWALFWTVVYVKFWLG